jgi:hypothetical protein
MPTNLFSSCINYHELALFTDRVYHYQEQTEKLYISIVKSRSNLKKSFSLNAHAFDIYILAPSLCCASHRKGRMLPPAAARLAPQRSSTRLRWPAPAGRVQKGHCTGSTTGSGHMRETRLPIPGCHMTKFINGKQSRRMFSYIKYCLQFYIQPS